MKSFFILISRFATLTLMRSKGVSRRWKEQGGVGNVQRNLIPVLPKKKNHHQSW